MRLACIMGLTAVLVIGSLTGAGTIASPGADFSLVPANQTVSVGQVFTIDIGVDAGIQELDTVEAHVNFDPTYLQVVDEDDNLLAGVTDGAIVPGSITTIVLTTGLLNRIDNGSGHAVIAYGISPVEGTLVNEVFVLGTIRFRAMAESEGTTITFSTASDRVTLAVRSGTNVTGRLTGSIVAITATGSPGEEDTEEPPAPGSETPSDEDALLSVTITSPDDGTTTSNPIQVITGTMNDASIGTATLSVNGRIQLITVTDGYFGEQVTLASGANTISVSVIDATGNTAISRITVSLTTSSSGEKAAGDVESGKTAGTAVASEDGDTPLSPQDKPLTWPIAGGIIGGILVIVLVVYFLTARTRF